MKRTVGPLNITLAIPLNGLQPNAEVRADKSKVELPKFGKHVLSNEGGLFPFVSDQPWELEVIIAEIGVYNSLFWYRNPKSPKPESLRVAYDYDCEANIMMQKQERITKLDLNLNNFLSSCSKISETTISASSICSVFSFSKVTPFLKRHYDSLRN